MEELEAALDELPEEQREVFIAHELEGRSFKELAAETGMSVNTLLSRKHYAVLFLRRRCEPSTIGLRANEEREMKSHWMIRVSSFWFAAVAVAVLGFVVMSLWNRLLPGLFGWET